MARADMSEYTKYFAVKASSEREVQDRLNKAKIKSVVDADKTDYWFSTDFCLARGIHTRFNQARRVEMLWALDRREEGDAAANALLREHGDQTRWPGVYESRLVYRTSRLWLLASKTRIAWRPFDPATGDEAVAGHTARYQEMMSELEQLIADYGEQATEWREVKNSEVDILYYAQMQGLANT
ncbi:MAG: hypothetical protein ACK5LN_13900 [Propioniciclava sp.]